MGLRINNNVNALTALTNLRRTDGLLSRSLERLSTGLRINRASDDPAGLVISEQFRAQIGSLKQAVENTQFDSNLIGTAEAALQEIENLIVKIRESAIFAKNTGGISDEQIEAEQDAVDSAIAAIDRIAATTRFGRRNLLNGASDFVKSANGTITDLTIRSLFMGPTSQVIFTAIITAQASQASATLGAGTILSNAGGSVTMRITGNLGTEDVTFFSTMSAGNASNAINAVRSFTGVYASGGTAYSQDFGSDVAISVEAVVGNVQAGFTTQRDEGEDIGVVVSGAQVDADGLDVRVNSSFLKAELTFSQTTAIGAEATGATSFAVTDYSGLVFQLGSEPFASDQIRVGITAVDSSRLGSTSFNQVGPEGVIGGFLSSLTAGGDNDLKTDPTNAIRILDAALDQVNGLRGYLGATDADTLQPNERSLNVAIENLVASESEIRDLDFAAETSEFTRQQILFNAGTAVLAAANLVPQQVLTLLQ